MKMLVLVMASAVALVSLSSCGECSCNSYNPDALRDVPVRSYRSFE